MPLRYYTEAVTMRSAEAIHRIRSHQLLRATADSYSDEHASPGVRGGSQRSPGHAAGPHTALRSAAPVAMWFTIFKARAS